MTKKTALPEVDAALLAAQRVFRTTPSISAAQRVAWMYAIAEALEAQKEVLISSAARETHLDPKRLANELLRTQWQLASYAHAAADGRWLDVRIDTPGTETVLGHRESGRKRVQGEWLQHTRQNDLRKMLVPLGPVVVFGASNFPFAYSTAGGDTAAAIAAGCPVIVKAHPAHAATSGLIAGLVRRAATGCGLPPDWFQHLEGDFGVGQALVQHPLTTAVAFTGSLEGGRALFDLAAARPHPIPVFAEMGSINPVFLLPEFLGKDPESLAITLAASISASAGQFCTNPGLLVGMESPDLDRFRKTLAQQLSMTPAAEMLHPGIATAFQHKRADVLGVDGVSIAGTLSCPVGPNDSIPTLATVPASVFLREPLLRQEVFGPFSLLVQCGDADEMMAVAETLEGQLTCTLMASSEELKEAPGLIALLRARCGRMIRNGVPTGVEVVDAMHHGGPYPATTDSRFTAVGADGIRRFARPVCYQNWEEALLPPELQNANPLGIWRVVNGALTQAAVTLPVPAPAR